ncbi:hypothetical protein ACHAXS_000644 [Conticribra weissflogii]
MQLIEEIQQCCFDFMCTLPYIYCNVFKGNSGALEFSTLPNMRSCTKHISGKCTSQEGKDISY